jgi:nucleotide-binding universal stress UspA family protein
MPQKSPVAKSKQEITSILCASDLSAYSDRAMDRAAILANETGAAIDFLHVVDSKLLPEPHLSRAIEEAKRIFEKEVGEIGLDETNGFSVHVESGGPAETILHEAGKRNASIIVVGLSSDATLLGAFRGTTADKLLRRGHCPVLVVKTRANRPYMQIVVAIDPSEPSRKALDFALHSFPKGVFTIVNIDETARTAEQLSSPASLARRNQIEDMVTARFLAANQSVPGQEDGPVLVFGHGNAKDALPEHISQISPDLVVLGTHTRTGVESMFLGSVAERMLEILRHDILIVRT